MGLPCECKRIRHYKNYRVCRVHDPEVPHGCKKDLIVEVYPHGQIIVREAGRRKINSYATTVGKIYSRLVLNEALAKARAKHQAKKDRKKARKGH